jgi:hypothetical protein
VPEWLVDGRAKPEAEAEAEANASVERELEPFIEVITG